MLGNIRTFNTSNQRKRALSKTKQRIEIILWYVFECHKLFLNKNITYSEEWVRKNTTYKFEDFLKFKFLDNYLIQNKFLLQDKGSELEEINFSGETQKSFVDIADGKEKPNKIDVYINKIGLQKEWDEEDENIYFAIELKRIKILSDTNEYIKDIQKFTNRNHTNLRLPFEGQIAFIESSKLNHIAVSNEVNKRLKANSEITTNLPLANIKLHDSFDSSYISKHTKNFEKKDPFSIYHLMFDYSKVVIN